MLDTNIAIHIRDADPSMLERLGKVEDTICLSIITLVELEGGAARAPEYAAQRRSAIDRLRQAYPVLPFDAVDVKAYRDIIGVLGFSRPQLLDRMIAAQAIAAGARLATLNMRDFKTIPNLQLEDWSG